MPSWGSQSWGYQLLQLLRFRAPIIQPVEEELERSVRLGAEVDLRSQHHYLAFAHSRFGDGRASVQILLAPCPAAVEHLSSLEPAHGRRVVRLRLGAQLEHRAAIEEHIHLLRHAIG